MAFNLNEFRAALNRHDGPAKDNAFLVTINTGFFNYLNGEPTIGIRESNKIEPDLQFFAQAVNIPGYTLDTTEHQRYGYGFKQKSVNGINFDAAGITFIVDSTHKITDYFHRWHRRVIRWNEPYNNGEIAGKKPFELQYRRGNDGGYEGVVTIKVFGKNPVSKGSVSANREQVDDPAYIYKLYGAYPSTVPSVQLGWNNNNAYLTQTVTFEYSAIEEKYTEQQTTIQDQIRDSLNNFT